jgi:hypothetical protein
MRLFKTAGLLGRYGASKSGEALESLLIESRAAQKARTGSQRPALSHSQRAVTVYLIQALKAGGWMFRYFWEYCL